MPRSGREDRAPGGALTGSRDELRPSCAVLRISSANHVGIVHRKCWRSHPHLRHRPGQRLYLHVLRHWDLQPSHRRYINGANASAGLGANLSATAGSQTVTFTNGAGFNQGTAIEYSGVTSLSNGSAVERSSPGTGAGALLGNSVVVPTGSWLYAIAWQENGTMSTVTNTAGNSRQSASSGLSFNMVDYAGAGSAIQPAFTVGTGTAGFVIVQLIMNPPAGATTYPMSSDEYH